MSKRRNWYEKKLKVHVRFCKMWCWVHGYKIIGREKITCVILNISDSLR